MVTDLNTNNQTDFVISSRAFMAMAIEGKAQDVHKLGIADVEYKRLVFNMSISQLLNYLDHVTRNYFLDNNALFTIRTLRSLSAHRVNVNLWWFRCNHQK